MAKKILIVEDDQNFLTILRNIFSEEKFDVISAEDGESGLDKALGEKPDIILSDVLLPKLNGKDMARKIRESGLQMPIIFLTNIKEEVQDDKEFDYLLKVDSSIDQIVEKVKSKIQ